MILNALILGLEVCDLLCAHHYTADESARSVCCDGCQILEQGKRKNVPIREGEVSSSRTLQGDGRERGWEATLETEAGRRGAGEAGGCGVPVDAITIHFSRVWPTGWEGLILKNNIGRAAEAGRWTRGGGGVRLEAIACCMYSTPVGP